MRRIFLWSFAGVTALSCVLCSAVVAMWARSYHLDDQFGRVHESVSGETVAESRSGVFSGEGRISIATVASSWARQDFRSCAGAPLPVTEDRFGWSRGSLARFYEERDESFWFGFGSNGNGVDYSVVSFPHWFVAALLTAPLLWWIGRRYEYRVARPRYLLEAYGVFAGWGLLMVQITGPLDLFVMIALVIYIVFRASMALTMHYSPCFEPGRCSHCGYDLRATRDRCPECGSVPITKE